MSSDPVKDHGFSAVPRNLDTFLADVDTKKNPPQAFTIEDVLAPLSMLAGGVYQYAQQELPLETFNHCMRVACFGFAIHKQYLSSHSFSHEAYILSSLLHDIGTAPHHQSTTHLSFEFQGGMIAHSHLISQAAPQELAESVAEAVIRHQDIGSEGMLTVTTAVLQVATVIDNTGKYIDLLDTQFIDQVSRRWPRKGWSGCFAGVVEKEMREKPWAHTTKLGENFVKAARGNQAMKKWD